MQFKQKILLLYYQPTPTTLHDIGDSTLHTDSDTPSPFVDAGVPARLCELHVSGVDPYTGTHTCPSCATRAHPCHT